MVLSCYLELEGLVETCGKAKDLQALELAPDFSPEEEKKDLDFVKLHDEGI